MNSGVIGANRAELPRRDLRRDRALARMLKSADAAAARGDYADALAWLRKIDTMGHELDPVYESRRHAWWLKMEAERVGSSQWFG
jgi:hypothetical protein